MTITENLLQQHPSLVELVVVLARFWLEVMKEKGTMKFFLLWLDVMGEMLMTNAKQANQCFDERMLDIYSKN